MKILLVDDDAFLRDMYATKFGELGDEVDTAKDGAEGLRRLSENKYEVILLDLVMPGLSGVDLIEAVLTHENAKGMIFTRCFAISFLSFCTVRISVGTPRITHQILL